MVAACSSVVKFFISCETAATCTPIGPDPLVVEQVYDQAYAEFRQMSCLHQEACRLALALFSTSFRPFSEDGLATAIHLELKEKGYEPPFAAADSLNLWPQVLFLDMEADLRPVWRLSRSSVADFLAEHPSLPWTPDAADCQVSLTAMHGAHAASLTAEEKLAFGNPQSYARHHWLKHVSDSVVDELDTQLTALLRTFMGSPFSPGPLYWIRDVLDEDKSERPSTSFLNDLGIEPLLYNVPLRNREPRIVELMLSAGAPPGGYPPSRSHSDNALAAAAASHNTLYHSCGRRRMDNMPTSPHRRWRPVQTPTNGSPLAAAALSNHVTCLRLLLVSGANVNAAISPDYGSALAAATLISKATSDLE
ncbi:hypothetical protein QBC34DRAFT_456684 [Podospora aff. communis PSN243]|uniref:Uncharacterized protein n=1 Tax=Podospora aff. communis PSN243 TaxID=3040156 RepID=A0AAV9G0J0_9PEZI|nr:hypothetical protein QBC34DRAFT_456684 [Podospora aff. communis PSN243]